MRLSSIPTSTSTLTASTIGPSLQEKIDPISRCLKPYINHVFLTTYFRGRALKQAAKIADKYGGITKAENTAL